MLIVNVSAGFGGAETRVLQLARVLKDQALVVCLAQSPLEDALRRAGLDFMSLPLRRHSPRWILAIRRLARNHHASVVDCHSVHSQLWGTLASVRAPWGLVLTVHSDYGTEHPRGWRRYAYPTVLRLARRTRAQFVAVSGNVAASLADGGVEQDRIHVVRNAAPPRGVVASPSATRRQLGASESRFLVAVVARLEVVKGHDWLISAVDRLRECLPELLVVLVGDGPLREALCGKVDELGLEDHVKFLGFRRDVASIFEASDAACLPSDGTEGLPISLLEAAAAGRAIVATRLGDIPTVFEHRSSALLVRPGDTDELAAAILELARDARLRHRLGARAAATVARWDEGAMVGALSPIYRLPNGGTETDVPVGR